MSGYWLKPDTGECVKVATTHDAWIRDQEHAARLGLPAAVYDEIMSHPPTAVDEIRLLAVKCGLVRIREHRWHVSVQFWTEPHRVGPLCGEIVKALHGVGIHADTRLVIDNLSAGDRVAMTLRELEVTLENGQEVI